MARRKKDATDSNGAAVAAMEAPVRKRRVGWRWKSTCGTFGVLHIDNDGTIHDYFCRYLFDGKWQLTKLVCGNERTYVVQATRKQRCTCDGYCGHGHCKHVEAFAALLASGGY